MSYAVARICSELGCGVARRVEPTARLYVIYQRERRICACARTPERRKYRNKYQYALFAYIHGVRQIHYSIENMHLHVCTDSHYNWRIIYRNRDVYVAIEHAQHHECDGVTYIASITGPLGICLDKALRNTRGEARLNAFIDMMKNEKRYSY